MYGRRDVDRMAILHDLWTSEAHYQDNKMKVGMATVLTKWTLWLLQQQLVNCYLEVYHNTSNRKERERLAKVNYN